VEEPDIVGGTYVEGRTSNVRIWRVRYTGQKDFAGKTKERRRRRQKERGLKRKTASGQANEEEEQRQDVVAHPIWSDGNLFDREAW
jgi:hypothetical protein